MSEMLKKIQGIKYLLTHPRQVKWILIREVRYGKRNKSKRMWVEWQKYDSRMHIAMMHAQPEALKQSRESPLSRARVKVFSEMFSGLGNGLDVLDVGCGDGVIGEPVAKMGNKVTSLELPGIANIAQLCRVPFVVAPQ
jgi:2-polyprenyl-3-methyl-5-hydroxy-6-metoxy-1,4-benzoquinol methylase